MIIEKFNIIIIEMIFHFLKNKINLFQHIQYQRIIFKIFIEDLWEYHDIIDIYENKVLLIIIENNIHDLLKMNKNIFEIERYMNIFSKSILNNEDNK